ncbi:MAG TPA: quinolinate synthase NadA, partial [Arthrobacter sp.]|nr:quinolinate synthase NadA [Arthrobacter sp.]
MSSVNTAIQLITREQAEGRKTAAPALSTCSPALARGPWDFDLAEARAGVPGYGPGASSADAAPPSTPRQVQLPEEYKRAGDAELGTRIRAAKAALGERAVILGHFYQRDEV